MNIKPRYILYVALGLLGASFLGFFYNAVNIAAFVLFGLLGLILGLWKREYALYLAFLELAIGSFGHLLAITAFGVNIPFRMALFAVVMGLWAWDIVCHPTSIFPPKEGRRIFKFFRKKKNLSASLAGETQRGWLLPLGLFFFIWLAAVLQGYLRGASPADIFSDANAYLYFLMLLPAISYLNTKEKLHEAFKVILTGAAITGLMTFFLYLAFTWSEERSMLQIIYKWIRDFRIGEITPLDNGSYRIFLQSQIYLIFGLLLVSAKYLYKKINFNWFLLLGAIFAGAIYLSLSRSFWVGAAAGFAVFFILAFWQKKKEAGRPAAHIFGAILIGILIANILMPKSSLENRFAIGEAATDTRLSQFEALIPAIEKNPIFGYGFGKTLTYKSFDPRLGDSVNGVLFTTDAFELGYLDMLLKFGFLGLAALFYFLGVIIWQLIKNIKEPEAIWALSGLAALLAIHAFTPYLNHPLGIGMIVLAGVVASIDRK